MMYNANKLFRKGKMAYRLNTPQPPYSPDLSNTDENYNLSSIPTPSADRSG